MKANRRVAVTGAASGIGLAIARRFHEQGDLVTLVDVNPLVQGIADELRRTQQGADAYTVDLADPSQVEAFTRRLKVDHGGCDVLVNCAGIAPKKNGGPVPLADVTVEGWKATFQVNVVAPFILCRDLIPGMVERGYGRIVNIGSITGETYRPLASIDYSASKAALMGLTRRLAGEYAPYGVTVNNVAPGRIQTPLSSKSAEESAAIARQTIPMRRGGTTQEVASAVIYLASDDASFITGACIDVNGGDRIG